jgi:hypothetical protein
MQDTNWDLVQFKYEFLGFSLADLASEHSISPAVLEYNAKHWNQILLDQDNLVDLNEIKSIDDIISKLGKQTINQSEAFSIIKQKFLGPKFIELETILLHKAISIASNVDEKDPRSANTLKNIVEVLTSLLSQNPLLGSKEDTSEGDGDKVWEIKIVNAPEPKSDPAEPEPKEEE